MRILFIASENTPFAPKQGAEQRTCLLLKACVKVGDVDVINFCDDEVNDTLGTNLLYSRCLNSNTYCVNSRMNKVSKILTSFLPSHIASIDKKKEKIIDAYIQKEPYDCIVTRYALSAVNCGLYKYSNRLVVDVDDNPADKLVIIGRTAKTKKAALFYSIYAQNVRFAMRRFDKKVFRVFYSNPTDCTSSNAILLPNIPFYNVDSAKSQDYVIKNRLLFIGDMTYEPNIEAVDRFLNNVYITIVNRCDEVSFHIVGRCQDVMKGYWESFPGVRVMGFLPSLEQEYAESCVVVLPIYSGGGTCIKFLESIQMGRPVVSTECGFRGYAGLFEENTDCCIVKDDDEFVHTILGLFNDEKKRIAMTVSANTKFRHYYSREYFDDVVRNALYVQNIHDKDI